MGTDIPCHPTHIKEHRIRAANSLGSVLFAR